MNNIYFCVTFYGYYTAKCITICRHSSPIFILALSIISFSVQFEISKHSLTEAQSTCFSCLFPWHGSSHSRQHWSDLFEMNGLITGSERRRNTVWRGDEWNWGLGLRKPLRQIEGINDCNTARGPQRPTLFFPWHDGCVMASLAALFFFFLWRWVSSGSVAEGLTWWSFPHLRDFPRSQRSCRLKPQEPPAPQCADRTAQRKTGGVIMVVIEQILQFLQDTVSVCCLFMPPW